MAHFLASWGSLDICHRDSGYSAALLQVAPTDRIRDTTQKTDVRRPKHPCTFLRVFVRRIWVEAWLEICLRPAGSNDARLITSDVKSVLPLLHCNQTFCGKRASALGLECQSSTMTGGIDSVFRRQLCKYLNLRGNPMSDLPENMFLERSGPRVPAPRRWHSSPAFRCTRAALADRCCPILHLMPGSTGLQRPFAARECSRP